LRDPTRADVSRDSIHSPAIACTALLSTIASSAGAQVLGFAELRDTLDKRGIQPSVVYYGETFGNPVGGARQHWIYDGRLGLVVHSDLEKLMGWPGATIHASGHLIHGVGLSGTFIQNLMPVSGIEAPPSVRLFNLWVEQALGVASLRVGQFTAAQEFLVTQYGTLFVNGTFGWPVITAVDLPSGGLAYPEAALGSRLKVTPLEELTLMLGLFDGDPSGPGPGNPVDRDPHGLAFRLADAPFLVAEAGLSYNEAPTEVTNHQEGPAVVVDTNPTQEMGPPGSVKLGGWYHAGRFADQQFDSLGQSLADPMSTGLPAQHRGNFGLYAVVDQMLWRGAAPSRDQGIGAFARVSGAPSDRNLVVVYADAGLTFKGLIGHRADDAFGVAVAYGRISANAAARDRQTTFFTGQSVPVRDFEAAIEVTYQAKIVEGWSVQPDVQYIVHPGGHEANPLDPTDRMPMRNAFVAGARSILRL